jgi:hypothetical protein
MPLPSSSYTADSSNLNTDAGSAFVSQIPCCPVQPQQLLLLSHVLRLPLLLLYICYSIPHHRGVARFQGLSGQPSNRCMYCCCLTFHLLFTLPLQLPLHRSVARCQGLPGSCLLPYGRHQCSNDSAVRAQPQATSLAASHSAQHCSQHGGNGESCV